MKKGKLAESMKNADAISSQVKYERNIASAKASATQWKNKYEHVMEELALANARAEFVDTVEFSDKVQSLSKLKPSGEATAICVWSDWHVEERIEKSVMNGTNEYSPEIALKRLRNMFRRSLMMIDVARGLTKIDTLVVAVLGDLITGYIHPELEESNYLSPTEATEFAGDALVEGLTFFAKEGGFKEIIVPCCVGNHGRTTMKQRVSTSFNNSFEGLMYKLLEKHTQIPQVKWKIEKSYHNWLNIQGHETRFHHGEAMKFGGGVGGITIPVKKALHQWNQNRPAAYDFFGHFHQSINMNRWTCNGSVIGMSPYAIQIKAESEEPSQTVSVISRARGKVFTERVFCD